MKSKIIYVALFLFTLPLIVYSQSERDTTSVTHTLPLNEVVVTGTRYETDIRHLPMSISVVSHQQISNRYEQSLLPILTELVPGFFTTSRGVLGYGIASGSAGAMKLRGIGGSPTAGLLVLIDGHPQYMGLMGHPLADAYQSILANKVEVLRGPASVLYGSNAMGGVINIISDKLNQDARKTNIRLGYGSYNTLMTEAVNRYRKDNFSNVLSISYNRTDGHRRDMDFEQFSGYTKFGYEFSKQLQAFVDINITHFDASNPGTVATPIIDNDNRVTRGMTSFSLENNYGNTSGAFKFFYNWGRHKINDGYSVGEAPMDYRFNSKDQMLGITWYQSATLFTGNRITVGLDYQHFGGNAWNQFVDNRKEIADKTENEVAGYINIRQSLSNLLTLDMGIRVDNHSKTGIEWIPQGGVALQLPHSAELKAMMSKGFRNPTIRELYMFPTQNADLMPERIINYELSYSQRLMNDKLYYGVNIFYINGDNMITTIPIEGRPKNINTGEVKNWGVETNVSYRISPSWSVSGNYSWLKMKYPVVAAPEHKLYVGADFTKNKWNISTGIQYIDGLYTNTDPDITENFVLWNVRASYQILSMCSLFVKGENLLAQQYEINKGYPMPKATIMGGININF